MSFRLVGVGSIKQSRITPLPPRPAGTVLNQKGDRKAYFGQGTGWVICPIYDRRHLLPDDKVKGPCFVEDTNTVVVLYPHHQMTVDGYGNLHVEIPG